MFGILVLGIGKRMKIRNILLAFNYKLKTDSQNKYCTFLKRKIENHCDSCFTNRITTRRFKQGNGRKKI